MITVRPAAEILVAAVCIGRRYEESRICVAFAEADHRPSW